VQRCWCGASRTAGTCTAQRSVAVNSRSQQGAAAAASPHNPHEQATGASRQKVSRSRLCCFILSPRIVLALKPPACCAELSTLMLPVPAASSTACQPDGLAQAASKLPPPLMSQQAASTARLNSLAAPCQPLASPLPSACRKHSLLDKVEVVTAHHNGASHLGALHAARQDAAADGDVACEGALVVNVVACRRGRDGRGETKEERGAWLGWRAVTGSRGARHSTMQFWMLRQGVDTFRA
jgi:hypothetical protein